MNHIKVCWTMWTPELGMAKKRMCGRGETKAKKSLCAATCRHGYRACRLPNHCYRSMLAVRIKGPKSWINLHQRSGPASKKSSTLWEGGGVLRFHFSLSLYITFSFFSTYLWGSILSEGEVRGGSVRRAVLCDGWLDKEVDRTCPIPLLFTLADEKPGPVLTEMLRHLRNHPLCFHPKNKTDYPDRVDGVKLWNSVYFERASTFTRLIKSRPAKHFFLPHKPPKQRTNDHFL